MCCCVFGQVLATDVSEAALAFTSAAASAQGLAAVETRVFDTFAQATSPLPRADVLLLSDCFVTDELARAHAGRVTEACRRGFSRVFVVDPGRSSRSAFLDALGGEFPHDGFVDADECRARARAGETLLLLDTDVGAPVSYCI